MKINKANGVQGMQKEHFLVAGGDMRLVGTANALFEKGYDTFIEQGGANLSGGQKQRLCIARALLKNPKVLIFDDSTSAVDTKTDSMIQKAFKENLPDTTKIIISQRISSVQSADKIIVMDGGQISGIGNHEYLLDNCDIYREIFELQQKGGSLN